MRIGFDRGVSRAALAEPVAKGRLMPRQLTTAESPKSFTLSIFGEQSGQSEKEKSGAQLIHR